MVRTLSYRHQIFNESGYVLMAPQVSEDESLLLDAIPNPFAESATQKYPLGTKLINGERVWRYCKNSAAALTIVGSPIQSAVSVHSDIDEDLVVAASAGETYAIGSYDITLTNTTNTDAAPWTTADGGKDGYVYVNGGTGIGQCRKIKGHTAATDQATMIIYLYEPWNVAIVAGNSECGLVQNPYSNVVVSGASTGNMMPIGVNPLAVTASYYFWAQTGGPAAVVCHAAIALGTWAVTGTTAGEIDPGSATTTEFIIGYPITAGIKDNDHAMIFLILDS